MLVAMQASHKVKVMLQEVPMAVAVVATIGMMNGMKKRNGKTFPQ